MKFNYLIIFLTIISCNKQATKEKDTLIIKTQEKETEESIKCKKSNSKQYDPYLISYDLLQNLFKTEPKFIDIKSSNKIIPSGLEPFNPGFENARLYNSPDYNDNDLSKFYEHYSLIIIEYFHISMAEKSMLQFIKNNDRLLSPHDIPTNNKKLKTIANNSKYGGLVFYNDKYIISVNKTCNGPKTNEKITWDEYEKLFMKNFLGANGSTPIYKAKCGNFKYYNTGKYVQGEYITE